MKLKHMFVLMLAGAGITARAQSNLNDDFEQSPVGTISSNISGWSLSSGSHSLQPGSNSCNLLGCCQNPPAYSEIIDCSAANGFTDNIIGSQYPIYSVFGSNPVPAASAANQQVKQGMYGSKILRLNNTAAGDRSIEKISKTFTVTMSNALFQFAYIPVFNGGHGCCDNSAFQLRVMNNGTVIPCPSFSVSAPGAQCTATPLASYLNTGTTGYVYHPWKVNAVDLTPYIGMVVNIEMSVSDCTLGDHFSYVYVDSKCGPMSLYINGSPKDISLISTNIPLCGVADMCMADGLGPYEWAGQGVPSSYAIASFTNACYTSSVSTQYTIIMNPENACAPVYRIVDLQITAAPQLSAPLVFNLCGSSYIQISPFINGSTGGYNFSWLSPPNAIVSGMNTSVLTTNTAGVYTVMTSSSSNSCTSKAQVTVVACVGLDKNEPTPDIRIFPNPTSGLLWLRSEKSLVGAWLELYDLTGKLLIKEKRAEKEIFINLENYDAGIYQLHVGIAGKRYHFKIVKE